MLIGYDIATRRTGFCAGVGDVMPEAGVLEFPQHGDDFGALGFQWRSYLSLQFHRLRPTAVVYEAPILRAHDVPQTLIKLYGMAFTLATFCREAGVPCSPIDLRKVKKELTGNSFAAKDDMVAVARRVGVSLPDGKGAEDAADAFGAWLCGLRDINPSESRKWDSRIWSPRGALI